MKRSISTRYLSGRQRLGVARHHAVVTDRMLEEGGTDIGCTSGELLLLAIGSCATGGVSKFLQGQGVSCENLSMNVSFEAPAEPGERDRIVISINVDLTGQHAHADAIRTAAVSGGVTSRMHAATPLEVRIAGLTG